MATALQRAMPVYHFHERHSGLIPASPDVVWQALTTITFADLRITRQLVALRYLGRPPLPAHQVHHDVHLIHPAIIGLGEPPLTHARSSLGDIHRRVREIRRTGLGEVPRRLRAHRGGRRHTAEYRNSWILDQRSCPPEVQVLLGGDPTRVAA